MLMTSKTQIKVPFVCRQSVQVIPNLNPSISNLSQNVSSSGAYTIVYIYGNNFSLYGSIGTSVVNFGNFTGLPVSFYSSQELSFSVPANAQPGNYTVVVENLRYPTPLISNSINYTVN